MCDPSQSTGKWSAQAESRPRSRRKGRPKIQRHVVRPNAQRKPGDEHHGKDHCTAKTLPHTAEPVPTRHAGDPNLEIPSGVPDPPQGDCHPSATRQGTAITQSSPYPPQGARRAESPESECSSPPLAARPIIDPQPGREEGGRLRACPGGGRGRSGQRVSAAHALVHGVDHKAAAGAPSIPASTACPQRPGKPIPDPLNAADHAPLGRAFP